MRGRRGSFGARARASRDGASVRERQLRGPAGRRAAAPAAAPSAAPASGRPRPRPRPARRVAASNNGCALGPASAAGARRAGPLPGRAAPGPAAAACAPRPSRSSRPRRRRRRSPARAPRLCAPRAALPRPVPRPRPRFWSLLLSPSRAPHAGGGPPAAASTSKSFVALRHGFVFVCRF